MYIFLLVSYVDDSLQLVSGYWSYSLVVLRVFGVLWYLTDNECWFMSIHRFNYSMKITFGRFPRPFQVCCRKNEFSTHFQASVVFWKLWLLSITKENYLSKLPHENKYLFLFNLVLFCIWWFTQTPPSKVQKKWKFSTYFQASVVCGKLTFNNC